MFQIFSVLALATMVVAGAEGDDEDDFEERGRGTKIISIIQ
jgi:hypothetical protein